MVSKYELSFFYFKMEFEYLKWFLQRERERERENDGFSFFLKTGLSGLIVWSSEKLVGMYGFILFCPWKFILEFPFAQFSGNLKHFVVFIELF